MTGSAGLAGPQPRNTNSSRNTAHSLPVIPPNRVIIAAAFTFSSGYFYARCFSAKLFSRERSGDLFLIFARLLQDFVFVEREHLSLVHYDAAGNHDGSHICGFEREDQLGI